MGRIYSIGHVSYMDSQDVKVFTMFFNGKRQTFRQWSKETGINESVLRMRKKRGWSDEETITTTIQDSRNSRKGYRLNGQSYSLVELSQLSGLPVTTLYDRIKQTNNVELAVTTPKYEWRDAKK